LLCLLVFFSDRGLSLPAREMMNMRKKFLSKKQRELDRCKPRGVKQGKRRQAVVAGRMQGTGNRNKGGLSIDWRTFGDGRGQARGRHAQGSGPVVKPKPEYTPFSNNRVRYIAIDPHEFLKMCKASKSKKPLRIYKRVTD
jgi:hypothetical protein